MSILLVSTVMLILPAMVAAQSEPMNANPPPIGQVLVREGDFAVRLAAALSVGTSKDEVEAEDQLTQVGIMPKNGWIADYPVTPDIIDELYKAVRDAAAADRIPMGADVALQKMHEVVSQVGLAVETQAGGKAYSAEPSGTQSAPSSAVINNYYYNEGPPTVTYYAPPPDYAYMYGWVPSPFWCAGFWFPGFFILHDFHRTVFIADRVVFVSNHFTDFRRQRVIRIDPVARLNGNTIANTRVAPIRGAVPAFRRDAIVNTPRASAPAGLPTRSGTDLSRPLRDNRTMSLPARDSGVANSRRSSANAVTLPSRHDGFVGVPRSERVVMPHATRGEGTPFRGTRMMNLPSRGGFERMPFRGGGSFSGRGRR